MDEILLTKRIGITDTTKKAGYRLLSLVWQHKWAVIGGVLCTIVMSGLTGVATWVVKEFIDKALMAKDMDMLKLYSLAIIGMYALRWPFAFLHMYLVTLGGLRVVEDLRNRCYRSLQAMSFGYFENQRSGDLMSRISNDTTVIQMFVTSGVSEILKLPIVIAVMLSVALSMSAKLTLMSFIILPVIAGIISLAGHRMKNVSLKLQSKIAELNIVLAEILSSMHVVKSFSMEEYEIKKFAVENNETVKATLKQVAIRSAYSPLVELIGACGLAVILWIGGKDVVNETPDPITGRMITAGSVLAIFFALQQIYQQVNRINHINLALQHAFAAADRTFEIMDMKPDIPERTDAVLIPEIKGNIEYRNVEFEYNSGEKVLKGVNVKVEPGMVVALVGSSGSGKSTFIKLLPRFYDVTAGSITIEGIDVRDAKISSFRPHIGIVPQDTILFRTTIKENIRYGRIDATDEQIREATEAAFAHEFIAKMPKGYNTMVGERGVTLSGGQRQRIAIARAILKDPDILILDEATSNVDNVSEQYIQKALEILMRGRTTFVVAHRLTTIRNADLILVLESGEIVQSGKHDDLYAQEGVYKRLYDLNLQKDEKS